MASIEQAPQITTLQVAQQYIALEKSENEAFQAYEKELNAWHKRRERHLRGSKSPSSPFKDAKPRPPPKRTSLRAFARTSPYGETILRRHLHSLRKNGLPAWSNAPRGRPQYLLPHEDEALARFAKQLSHVSFPALKETIRAAANMLRSLRGEEPVGPHFIWRWLAKHPDLRQVQNQAG